MIKTPRLLISLSFIRCVHSLGLRLAAAAGTIHPTFSWLQHAESNESGNGDGMGWPPSGCSHTYTVHFGHLLFFLDQAHTTPYHTCSRAMDDALGLRKKEAEHEQSYITFLLVKNHKIDLPLDRYLPSLGFCLVPDRLRHGASSRSFLPRSLDYKKPTCAPPPHLTPLQV